LGQKELQRDLTASDGVLDRLKRKISREDLYDTWMFNWSAQNASANGSAPIDMSLWSKGKLWEHLLNRNLLRAMVVVAGVGPRASGMPELQFLMNMPSRLLGATSVLVTDGRVSFQHAGVSIAHVVPEAIDGGGLASIRTGDWIYLDLSKGEFQVVAPSARGHKVLSAKDLANRAERKKRISELERRRQELLPSFRILLDQISSAESGVSPASKAI
jgi:dihydroxyacid dehydratase/phosphogluconate dehydratase